MNPIELFFTQTLALHVSAGTVVLLYLIGVNLLAFWTMRSDKKKARRGEYRTPEAVLFLQAIIGGSIGSNLGMLIYRHKTRKPKFRIGMPAILLVQLLLVLLLYVCASEVVFL